MLGEIRDPRSVEPLILSLKDEDREVREQVVTALSKIEDIRALQPLTVVKGNDENEAIRKIAAKAVKKIKRKKRQEQEL